VGERSREDTEGQGGYRTRRMQEDREDTGHGGCRRIEQGRAGQDEG
jgi:hypothetical protein